MFCETEDFKRAREAFEHDFESMFRYLDHIPLSRATINIFVRIEQDMDQGRYTVVPETPKPNAETLQTPVSSPVATPSSSVLASTEQKKRKMDDFKDKLPPIFTAIPFEPQPVCLNKRLCKKEKKD